MPAQSMELEEVVEVCGRTSMDRNRDQAGRYEIRLKGHVDRRWAAWFDGLSLSLESDGTTTIHGRVADQAALHGLLQKVRDVGLPLVSVICVEPDQPGVPTIEPRQAPTQLTKRRLT
jgi:hypothetical protein